MSPPPSPVVTLATTPSASNVATAALGTAAPGTGTDALSVALISDADFTTGSKLVLNNGTLVYTPGLVTAGLVGTDTLKYSVTDTVTGAVTSETQTVTLSNGPVPLVTLAPAPLASNTAPAILGTAAPGTGTDALSVTLNSDADFASGSKLVLNNGTLVYTPGAMTAALVGSDTLTYSVTDTVTGAATAETQSVMLSMQGATWAFDIPGNFDSSGSWSGGSVPATAADAVINYADDPLVLHNTGSDTVHSLTNTAGDFVMSGGTLTVGTLTNVSLMAFTGGLLNTGTLANSGTLTIAGNGQTLTGATINTGTILGTGGQGQADIAGALTNNGQLTINQGTISLDGGGTSSGYGIAVGASGTLQASGGDFAITGGFFAPGNVAVTGGTLDASTAGVAVFVDTLGLTAGLLSLGTLSATDQGSLTQTGGTLAGNGTLSVIAGGVLTSGLETGTGTTELQRTSAIGGGIQIAGGYTVRNDQWLNWSAGNIVLNNGTLTNNQILYVAADARIAGAGSLINTASGAIAVYAGSGETDIDAALANSGGLQVQTGTLSLNGGGSSSGGGIFTAASAVLQFGTTATGASNGFTITSGFYAPSNTVLNGGTLNVAGASAGVVFVDTLNVTAGALLMGGLSPTDQGSLTQTGGLITGSGTLSVTGGGFLTGGVQSGGGLTALFGTSGIGGGFAIDGGRTVANDQWLNWSSGNIVLGSGDSSAATQTGTLLNNSIFYVTADARIAGSGTFDNTAGAVIAVYAGAGETDIDADTVNAGGIQAQTGVLSLNGGGTSNASNLFAASGAVVQFGTMASGGSGTFTFTGGLYTVAATRVSGSTVNFAGAAAAGFSASLELTSGAVQLGTLSAVAGVLSQSGGTLSGSGFLTASGGAALAGGLQTGAGVTVLQGVSSLGGGLALDGGRILENTGTLTWSAGTLTLGGGDASVASHAGVLQNVAGALLEIEGTATVATAGSASIVNAGTILSLGTGKTAVNATVTNTGTIEAMAGTLTLAQGASGGGVFLLGGGAALDFAGPVTSGATLQFLNAGGTLETTTTGLFGAGVSGFASSDVIDATSVSYNASDVFGFAGGTLSVSDGTHMAMFQLAGSYTAAGSFHISSDGHGGTALTFG